MKFTVKSLKHFTPEGDPEKCFGLSGLYTQMSRTNRFRGDKEIFPVPESRIRSKMLAPSPSRWLRDHKELLSKSCRGQKCTLC
jgi:hypothetical protein